MKVTNFTIFGIGLLKTIQPVKWFVRDGLIFGILSKISKKNQVIILDFIAEILINHMDRIILGGENLLILMSAVKKELLMLVNTGLENWKKIRDFISIGRLKDNMVLVLKNIMKWLLNKKVFAQFAKELRNQFPAIPIEQERLMSIIVTRLVVFVDFFVRAVIVHLVSLGIVLFPSKKQLNISEAT